MKNRPLDPQKTFYSPTDCKFFILAGGYGKRAQPLSFIKPKPLFPLHGTPLIQILLHRLQEKGLQEGWINLHYMPGILRQGVEESLKKPGAPRIRYLVEKELSGSMILRAAAEHLTARDLLLVVNGDIFPDIPLEEMRTALLNDNAEGILLVRENREKDPRYTIIQTGDDRFTGVENFTGDHRERDDLLMYTGVALFKKNVLQAIDDLNFFRTLERRKFKIKVFRYEGIWLDIGDPRSYFESNLAYKTHCGIKESNSLSGAVAISADSEVKDSIIWENTGIKNHSVLTRCIVTGNMSLDRVNYQDKIISAGPDGKTVGCCVPRDF